MYNMGGNGKLALNRQLWVLCRVSNICTTGYKWRKGKKVLAVRAGQSVLQGGYSIETVSTAHESQSGNPIGNPTRNPIGNPTRNPIGNPISNPKAGIPKQESQSRNPRPGILKWESNWESHQEYQRVNAKVWITGAISKQKSKSRNPSWNLKAGIPKLKSQSENPSGNLKAGIPKWESQSRNLSGNHKVGILKWESQQEF
ncbi:hypothetical protein BOTBODRAFT_49729 [Botryobasidium botryosum FD-172 SS1]|uniref:Uncharacterized protein n=1 Tax=Botryobasidium botryosum (strain FD-172 SS1) TaxID=930990 RepID=A0A067LU27_BOTB1|nr:hypothetical protein BOTBODRAFT_49729 [Botryobasidium botryosum FD-172 SS1]